MMRCRVVSIAVSACLWGVIPSAPLAQTGQVDVTAGQMQVSPHDPVAIAAESDLIGPGTEISPLAPGISLRPATRDTWAMPALRWDGHPHGARWTAAVMGALRGHGAPLLEVVPRDIHSWCPGYINAGCGQRAAFWAGLISALAFHESTHRPRAVGGGGRWFGLVQIAPGTARWRDCDVRSGQALLDGAANLRCGVRIMAITVPRDGVIAEGMRGVAADWGPFHSTRKREDMRNWVRRQDYCLPPTRPAMRPAGLVQDVMRPVAGLSRAITTRPAARPATGPGRAAAEISPNALRRVEAGHVR